MLYLTIIVAFITSHLNYEVLVTDCTGWKTEVMLPNLRKHKYEADQLGLIFLGMAGYDPNEAVAFWQRMAANSQGAPMEFMSTHPSDANRIAKLKEYLPEALKYYKK